MNQLNFDSGIREYKINDNGVLRFNPCDPNVYARFMEAAGKVQAVEDNFVNKAKELNTTGGDNHGEMVLRLLSDADKEVKQILTNVFGKGNDFDQILGGVNLLAVGANGERIITNFMLKADKDGVQATDVTVRNYLIVGTHARFEDHGDGRTACFWI